MRYRTAVGHLRRIADDCARSATAFPDDPLVVEAWVYGRLLEGPAELERTKLAGFDAFEIAKEMLATEKGGHELFQAALALTLAASEDNNAPLPPVTVWADELRVARGVPLEAEAKPAKTPRAPVDPLNQLDTLLRERLGPRFRLIQAVSFVNLGPKGAQS